jgi:hypothetical protein
MAAEKQRAVTASDANDEAALCEVHADLAGFGLRRRRNSACDQ